jgi:hypothetical protein
MKLLKWLFGTPYTKPQGVYFTLNWKEICIVFPKFVFCLRKKTKDEPRGLFQLIIGYKSMYSMKNNKGLIYINTAYDSTKYFLGIPVQRFLNKSYLECEQKNYILSEEIINEQSN